MDDEEQYRIERLAEEILAKWNLYIDGTLSKSAMKDIFWLKGRELAQRVAKKKNNRK